jgi:lysophospholipase L1-like esterase
LDETTASSEGRSPLAVGVLLSVLLIGATAVGQSGHVRAAFDFDSAEPPRWAAAGGRADLAARNGHLLFVPSTRDTVLRLAASFPARPVRWISIRARFVVEPEWTPALDAASYETGRHELTLAWTRTADSPLPEAETYLTEEGLFDGKPHTYEFPVGEQEGWAGTITSVDLDLLDARAPACRIEIDRIALLGHRPTALGSWLVLGVVAACWSLLAVLVRRRRRESRYVVAMLAPATAVFLLELALNFVAFEHPVESTLVRVLVNEVEMPGYRDFFRYDPQCLFTQDPDASYRAGERINEQGLRGPLPPVPREGGTLRVAAFGDSSTFGLGLSWADSYPARLAAELERLLASGPDTRSRRVEVINAGVIASTVVQGRRIFAHHVRRYRPDVVTLAFGAINEHYPTVLSDRERLRLTSRLPRWAYETRRWLLARSKTAQLLARVVDRGTDPGVPDDWLESSTRRVDPSDFAEELRGFVEDVRAAGGQVVLVSLPRAPARELDLPVLLDYSRAIEEVAVEKRVPLVDLRSRLAEFPQDEGEGYFLDSIHPGGRGSAWIARALAPAVLEAARPNSPPIAR